MLLYSAKQTNIKVSFWLNLQHAAFPPLSRESTKGYITPLFPCVTQYTAPFSYMTKMTGVW